MKFIQSLSLLLPLASAAVFKRNYTSNAAEVCKTGYGSISIPNVSTTTRSTTVISTQTQTVIITPTITISPSAAQVSVTTTATVTTTQTAPQLTGTVTTTLSALLTSTVSSTTTAFTTVTVTRTFTTTASGTTTISTVSGFTPVASLPSVQQGGGGVREKRNAKNAQPVERSINKRNKALLDLNGKCKQYPSAVTCTKSVEVISFTTTTVRNSQVPVTITAAPPAPTTSTITVTSTLTELVVPVEAIETDSITSTIITTSTAVVTATATVTTTSSTTTTSVVAQATAYAACAANNFINRVGSQPLTNSGAVGFNSNYISTNDPSPEACCNSCQAATTNCAGFLFLYGGPNPVGGGVCFQVQTSQCDATVQQFSMFNDGTNSRITFGDGPCGQGVYSSTAA